MKQFKAGYIIDAIGSTIINHFDKENIFLDSRLNSPEINKLRGLLQSISSFQVQFPQPKEINYHDINPVLASINNIISRGLPTKAPIIIEEKLAEIGLIKDNKNPFEFKYSESNKQIDYSTIFELLHIIEPGLIIKKNNYDGDLGSHLEWECLDNNPFLKQILQSQRDFASINRTMTGGRSVDFSFTSPYKYWNENKKSFENKTRIFEVDGPHHLINEYIFYDANRDVAAEEVNAETYRFTKNEIVNNHINFKDLISNDLYSIFEKNYNRNKNEFLTEYSIIFIPIAVARLQKTLLEHFILNIDLFDKTVIQIAIIERDIPAAALAIKSLEEYFFNINEILEQKDQLKLPKIELSIFQNKDWVIDPKINCGYDIKSEAYFGSNDFDIIIDHAVLKRSKVFKESTYTLRDAIVVRSSHFVDNSIQNARKVYCAPLLNYKSLVKRKSDGSYSPIKELEKHINFFIQNIFRKKGFREGQLPIISRALQQKPVIGLLPTGGGKSLTFQLPAFLQPGLCIIVDPIKSLMEDQVRVLKESWIDCCEFINSTITREEKNKKIIDFRLGETLFLFVSPERFIMEDFRKVVSNIHGSNFGLGFAFCVIDEVHCVSEWGHDFRYTYLMLGKNAQEFCKTRNSNKKVSLIGLTATASFDVLADIERELQIKNDDVANAIIMIENTIRPELFFNIINATGKNRMNVLNDEFLSINKNIGKLNNSKILEKSQRHHFKEFEQKDFALKDKITGDYILEKGEHIFQYNDNFLIEEKGQLMNSDNYFTITFCPVRGTLQDDSGNFINKSGVRYVHSSLTSESKGFYYASDTDEESVEVQNHFKDFTGNKTHQMVCTKAFGMGIDKSDIRSTFHYFYSSSLESFIQECGRAGRDKKIAIANIIVDTSKYYVFDLLKFLKRYPVDASFNRSCLRKHLEENWIDGKKNEISFKSPEDFILFIQDTKFSFKAQNGEEYGINDKDLSSIKKNILDNLDLLYEKRRDRGIHDYFFKLSFKGLEYEKAQIYHLIKSPEFENQEGLGKQPALQTVFNNAPLGTFDFIINQRKLYGITEIKKMFFIKHNNQDDQIKNTIKYATNFEDFIFKLDEYKIRELKYITEENKKELFNVFYRDRHSSDTGRNIYRLHSMGFLVDYTFDYNKRIYHATFIKYKSIDSYIDIIEKYLRRYLSENSALEEIENLKAKLSFNKDNLIDDIIESLYFISDFSYNEIVGKRKRATDEIENTLLKMISMDGDDYDKNCFLKEHIYFYFNAKYARPQFKINGKNYSLLDDHLEYRNNNLKNPNDLILKYLDINLLKIGPEQNNYKHLIGSCKKILNSLSESDLEKEWVLRLIKAFAMYATNNESYRSEANRELELGFNNLFNDSKFHKDDFDNINIIFKNYFKLLSMNIVKNNHSFLDIDLIKNKLLQILQIKGVEDFINSFNTLKNANI